MTTTFAALGVSPELVAALAERGINEPFAIQTLTIADAIDGRDVCGKAQTGSGKTLAFGLPVLQRLQDAPPAKPGRPHALILVPTRELAGQVYEVLAPLAEAAGLKVAALYGGASMDRQIKALKRGADIVVATPGRLIDLGDRNELKVDKVQCLVLDEADRMADMGFLPQVEWVLRRMTHEHQTLLFSATLDGEIDYLVKNYLTNPVRHELESPKQTVEQMQHRFLKVHQMDKPKVAAAIARSHFRTLLFVRTKRGADRLVTQLQREGVKAAAIHGDLRQTQRERALADFSEGKLPALVATDVAARGIHVDDIDVVVHFDPPEDHKAYLHRSGRTARAGQGGVVVTLTLWNQEMEVEKLMKRIGVRQPIVEVFSNDRRLSDLASWDPAAESAVA
ncbi:MAG TPA: DEAD/DEAH box helicase [Acidimicrobiales bacterium]|nr:DEAD/DEAH box helicase [Acidimicrobiales bacterium]